MENPIKMDDLGGFPPIFGSTPILLTIIIHPTKFSTNLKMTIFLSQGLGPSFPRNLFPPPRRLAKGPLTDGFHEDIVPWKQMSHEKNPALLSIESWLVNRDPYNGLWNNPYITG